MITEPQLMPDFRADLEEALYRRAAASTAPAAARRLPRVLPRPTLAGRLVAGAVVLVAALAVVLTSLPGSKPSRTAFAGPLILAQTGQPVPAGITPGFSVNQILGPDAVFERAIRIPVPAGTAYAIQSQRGWCLYGASDEAAKVYNSPTCVTDADLNRVGVAALASASGAGSMAIVLVPPGAAAPSVERAPGGSAVLKVSEQGVATTSLSPGDRLVLHATTGDDEVVPVP